MISHIPLGFGEPNWANKFHDWTAAKWSARGNINETSGSSISN